MALHEAAHALACLAKRTLVFLYMTIAETIEKMDSLLTVEVLGKD